MWTSQFQTLDANTIKGSVHAGSHILTFREVIQIWQRNPEFADHFSRAILSASSFEAFFWETPAVTTNTLDCPFEFVLVDAPTLARSVANASAFKDQFSKAGSGEVVTFPNLGRDAILIVPCPAKKSEGYPHFGKFLRTAPDSQKSNFWQAVGNAMKARVSELPTWLSTAGMGVPWLHLRLDSRPKYYRHGSYKIART